MISDQNRRQKSREVSSRYLSPTVAPPSPPLTLTHNNNHNHNHTLSPNHHHPKPKQKHKHTGFIRGIWPSSTTKSNNDNQTMITTKHAIKRSENSPVLRKQKSWSEKNSKTKNYLEEHSSRRSSVRFTGKLLFLGRPSISSSMSSKKSSDIFDSNHVILPGRLSVDENTLRRRTSYYQMRSDNSESHDVSSPFTRNSSVSYMTPTFKKSGIDVPTKCISPSTSMHNSPKNSTFMIKSRASSLSYSSQSECESSPTSSRLGSPSFSSSKPPTSWSRGTTKKNLLHIGLDLIKGKKVGVKVHSPLGSDARANMENVHWLRLLQNSLIQWRYVNARAQHVDEKLTAESENTLACGYESVAKLRQSVEEKRLQLQKEKQEMKLNLILHSQIKMLEAWEDIERRHMLEVSVMKDYLHAVVCMIPLVQGAKADLKSATMAFEDTSQMASNIKSVLDSVSPTAHETMGTLSELAEVVTQEKLLLEECFEHLRTISTLEIEERNLRCSIITMDSSDEQRQQKQQMFM